MPSYKLYGELAEWWPLVSAPDEYAEEARTYLRVLESHGTPGNASLLELGCGGGNNAVHLAPHFASLTLTDLSPAMLAVSRRLNPGCEHIEGDMRTLELARAFDAVLAQDAISYMNTREDLASAIATAFAHLKPGGLALFVPDHLRETFRPSTDHGGHDGNDRSLRFLEWVHEPEKDGTQYRVDYAFLLREVARPLRIESDRHLCGLFARAEWMELLEAAGFEPKIERDALGREMFSARRPRGSISAAFS